MKTTPLPLQPLLDLRRTLHSIAEASGHERMTAQTIRAFLRAYKPKRIIDKIGGHGLAAVFESGKPGPTVMYRAELDALPIPEGLDLKYASRHDGFSHKCGHDGHMTIACGVAAQFAALKPARGRVIILFQPAEETGEGAERVLADACFQKNEPDYIFALHNLPGFELGAVIVKNGVFAAASRGMIVYLTGATSHAAAPQHGNSPSLALATLIHAFAAVPQRYTGLHDAAQVTVVHAQLGERAFGTSPGRAVLMATLRSLDESVMRILTNRCRTLAEGVARTYQLKCEISMTEQFPATVNHDFAADLIRTAAREQKRKLLEVEEAFPWSEDFGHFLQRYRGAFFGIGAGKQQPALHHPNYNFPDKLIEPAVCMAVSVLRKAITAEDVT